MVKTVSTHCKFHSNKKKLTITSEDFIFSDKQISKSTPVTCTLYASSMIKKRKYRYQ